MSATHSAPKMGHNRPPADMLKDLLDPEIMAEQIEIDCADLFARKKLLAESEQRMRAALGPAGVQDDATAGRVNDLVKQLKLLAKSIEAARTERKAPLSAAVAVIDGALKSRGSDEVSALAAKIERDMLTPYATRKRDEARREAERAAEARRAEAERQQKAAAEALALAESTMHPELVEQAQAAIEVADAAQNLADRADRKAHAPDAELSRTRGMASSGSLRQVWKVRVRDGEFEKIPHQYLDLNMPAINAAIKAGVRDIPGLEIYDDAKVIVR